MGYSTNTGQTNQPQLGGTFQAQKGGVFDGYVLVDGPAGPAGSVGPVGPPITVTASASATQGQTAAATVATSFPATNTENLAFSFVLPPGAKGDSATVAVGTVTANPLAAGSTPTVLITDTGPASMGILNFTFGIPSGATGVITVGTVTTTTGPAGTQAAVTITPRAGLPGTLDFGFTIPRGEVGPQGPQGTAGVAATVNAGTATGLPAGASPTVTNSGTTSAAVFNFGIPAGAQGAQGPMGLPGTAGRGVVSITASNAVVAAGYATVTLTELFTDNTTATTSFNFPTGNNFTFGTGDPTTAPLVIPGLYLNSTNRSLWAYLTTQWVLVGGGSSTTIVTNADGTITVTDLGNNDFDVKLARQNANDGQFLAWSNATNKWVPKTPDVNFLNTSNNRLSLTVEGSTVETVPIITSLNVTTNGNLISIDANGVDSVDANIINSVATTTTNNNLVALVNGVQSQAQPLVTTNQLIFPGNDSTMTSIVNGVRSNSVFIDAGVLKIIAGQNVTISPTTGVGDVTINSVGGGAAGYVNLTEPSWRTVTQSGSGLNEMIVVTDNAQVPTSSFSGTNTPVFTYTNPTQAQLGLSQAGSQVIITATNIGGTYTKTFSTQLTRTPDQAYLDCQNPLTGNFWYAQSTYPASGSQDFWQPTQEPGTTDHVFTYQRALNGTRNPIHTNSALSIRWVGFTGGTEGTGTTVNAMLFNNANAPAFRNMNMADLEPLFTGTYPTNTQLATWNNGAISWSNPVVDTTTTVTQGNGISVVATPAGTNTDYRVNAALAAQNKGTALANTFYTVNAGTNITAVVANGVLTLNASGGGSAVLTIAPTWGTSGSANKQAYNNATGPTQGTVNAQDVTLTISATSSVGQISAATISFNGVMATGTYASTGTFPTYTITIPSSAIPAAAQTASPVTISVNGMYDGATSIFDGGMLTNTQPIPSVGDLSVTGQSPAARAFYAPAGTGTVVAQASATNGGTLGANTNYTLDTGTAQSSGTFLNAPLGLRTVLSTGLASGRFGAAINVPFNISRSTTLSQTTYTPAFYLQTANMTVPTFATTDPQSSGSGQGSTFTYPTATAGSQYNWVLTDRAIGNLFLATPFGNNPLTAQVTTTMVLSGLTLNLFGWTDLVVGQVATLIIT